MKVEQRNNGCSGKRSDDLRQLLCRPQRHAIEFKLTKKQRHGDNRLQKSVANQKQPEVSAAVRQRLLSEYVCLMAFLLLFGRQLFIDQAETAISLPKVLQSFAQLIGIKIGPLYVG